MTDVPSVSFGGAIFKKTEHEEEGGFVSKVQHSLRTFLNKVSLYSIEKEVLVVVRQQLLPICTVSFVIDI